MTHRQLMRRFLLLKRSKDGLSLTARKNPEAWAKMTPEEQSRERAEMSMRFQRLIKDRTGVPMDGLNDAGLLRWLQANVVIEPSAGDLAVRSRANPWWSECEKRWVEREKRRQQEARWWPKKEIRLTRPFYKERFHLLREDRPSDAEAKMLEFSALRRRGSHGRRVRAIDDRYDPKVAKAGDIGEIRWKLRPNYHHVYTRPTDPLIDPEADTHDVTAFTGEEKRIDPVMLQALVYAVIKKVSERASLFERGKVSIILSETFRGKSQAEIAKALDMTQQEVSRFLKDLIQMCQKEVANLGGSDKVYRYWWVGEPEAAGRGVRAGITTIHKRIQKKLPIPKVDPRTGKRRKVK